MKVFLCDYFGNTTFRRKTYALTLNKLHHLTMKTVNSLLSFIVFLQFFQQFGGKSQEFVGVLVFHSVLIILPK